MDNNKTINENVDKKSYLFFFWGDVLRCNHEVQMTPALAAELVNEK